MMVDRIDAVSPSVARGEANRQAALNAAAQVIGGVASGLATATWEPLLEKRTVELAKRFERYLVSGE